MPEPVPAIILSNIRKVATSAAKRGVKIDPRMILAIINGGRA